jgi:3-oxoisoapionate decarboxylase
MKRREFMKGIAGAAAILSAPVPLLRAVAQPKRLGIGMHSYGAHWNAARQKHPDARFHDPLSFLEYSHSLGAGGVQVSIGGREPAYARQLRSRAEELGLYLESQAALPMDASELPRFESEVASARESGARLMRTAFLSGRRYETFESHQEFFRFARRSRESLGLSEKVLKKYGLTLAIENHKDWLAEELIEMVEGISSAHVGVLVDTGNSIALLEDPCEVIEAYSPWAVSTHLKDMAVAEYEDGFLLSEVPLGEGFLDLPRIIATLEKANPRIQWNLEMITRDPLKIPCLREQYWATMDRLPAKRLARMLRLVKTHQASAPLPRVAQLTFEERLMAEENNVRRSLRHAAVALGL